MDHQLISIKSVQVTLKHLSKRDTLKPTNPLLSLNIVRQKMQTHPKNIDPALVAMYCVYELFEEILLAKLGGDYANPANALNFLIQDFHSNNQERQAYSLLYYLYLRSDCGLPDKEKLYALLCIEERTIRRRIQLGAQHLIFEIIAMESRFVAAPLSLPLSKRRMSG